LRRLAIVVLTCWSAGAAMPAAARAQSATQLVAQAVRAYQELDFPTAGSLLRRAMAMERGGLAPRERVSAFSYLAASELYRGRRDSAYAVFRRLVVFDPRARPDPLVFPPEVTTIFDFAREATKVAALELPAETTFQIGAERFPLRLYASSYHQIIVALTQENGLTVRTLYSGPISDTLDVRWDGQDATTLRGDSGRFLLTVTSLPTVGGQAPRVVRVALDLTVQRPETLPLPPPPADSLLSPERRAHSQALSALARGGIVSAGVLVLPAVVANGNGPSGPRIAVAGGVAIASVVAFFAQRPGRRLAGNIAANETLRAQWRAQRDEIARQNAMKARLIRLTVHSGRIEVIGGSP
jgi:hypothetical protein